MGRAGGSLEGQVGKPVVAKTHGMFPMDSIEVVGLVETEHVPKGTHPTPGAKRRWQEHAERILDAPEGKTVHLKVRVGVDPETLRQGVQAEFKRFGRKVSIRSVIEDDRSTSVYLTAIREAQADWARADWSDGRN